MAIDSKSGWPVYYLTDVFEIRSGLSKPAGDFGSGFPFVTFKDVLDNYFLPETLGSLVRSSDKERELCDVRRGDVFLTRTSETQEDLGMSCVALRDYPGATFNGFTKRLRPKDPLRVVPEYAAYFLRSPRFRAEMSAFSSLSTRASLNNDMIARLQIALPDVAIQEAIGSTLRSLDDKIEQNRRMGWALEELARATFKAWFVDFEPIKAKAAGQTSFPGMPPAAFAALPDRLTDSPLGPVPQGWEVAPLSKLMSFQGGAQPPAATFIDEPRDGYVRLVQIRDFYTDSHLTFVPDTTKLRKFNRNDVMIARYGSSSESAGDADSLARICRGLSGAFNVALVRVDPKGSIREFLYYYLQSAAFRSTIRGMGARSVQSGFRKEDLNVIPIVKPCDELATVFESFGADTWTYQLHLRDESRKLAALRDYLLPRLLSGRVRVPNVELPT